MAPFVELGPTGMMALFVNSGPTAKSVDSCLIGLRWTTEAKKMMNSPIICKVGGVGLDSMREALMVTKCGVAGRTPPGQSAMHMGYIKPYFRSRGLAGILRVYSS